MRKFTQDDIKIGAKIYSDDGTLLCIVTEVSGFSASSGRRLFKFQPINTPANGTLNDWQVDRHFFKPEYKNYPKVGF